jgi:subtilase family serine protease
VTDLTHAPTAARTPSAAPSAAAVDASDCEALSGLPSACNLPTDFASHYGLSSLGGASGAGQTIAIVTLAALDPGAPQWFWSNVEGLPASGRSVTVQDIDGGPGAPSDASGSGETDLDVEQSGGLAPGANVDVYQAPNTDNGFADAFFTAASQNVADSVSASWGESETYLAAAVASGAETPAYEAAFDEAFLELAAQGQSTFLSAGDSGAYDASGDLGTTNLSVDSSGDSPYVTSAGGITLPWSGSFTLPGGTGTGSATVTSERAWGWDYLWPAFASINGQTLDQAAEANVAGGGGGFSTIEPTPSYQQGVSGASTYQGVQWLTPIDAQLVGGIVEPTAWDFDPTPVLVRGRGTGRSEPDLSTDADPFTGYLLYEPSFAGVDQPTLQGGWGGTSFVAPQLNGSTAVIDSYVGHRVGLWNPSVYAFAQSGRSPFTPLQTVGTSNDNDFYTGQPGALYNQATGLGTPNLGRLARDFAAEGN